MVNTIKNNKHKVKTEKQMVRKDTKINQKIVLKLGKKSTEAFSVYQEACWNSCSFLHDGLKKIVAKL